jgi:hypothetical protein
MHNCASPMTRRIQVLSLFAAMIVSGCKCKSNYVVSGGDAGGPGADGGGHRSDGGLHFTDGGFIGSDGGFFMGGGVGPGGFVLAGADGGGGTGVGNGVGVDPDAGGLVLNSQNVQLHYAWIANNAEGWVCKYDSDTGREVARYYSVIPIDGMGNPSPVKYDDFGGNSPSRTAIDLFGNAWVGNRAPVAGVNGSVTKIANSITDCIDRNHNGKIDTSSDLNGDGVIDTRADAGEFIVPTNDTDPTTYDECVLFSTPVGNNNGNVQVRALAISQGSEGTAGDIWAGIFSLNEVIRLNSVTGQVEPVTPNNPNGPMSIPLPGFGSGFGPYGAAVDGLQRLWVVRSPSNNAQLAMIDTTTGTLMADNLVPPASMGPTSSYGMGIDGKSRVWIAGLRSGPYVFRYDNGPGLTTANGVWTKFDFTTATSAQGTTFSVPRGIAADDQGLIWASGDSPSLGAAYLIAFNGDTGAIHQFAGHDFIDATDTTAATATNQSIGVGIDRNDNVWVNNYSGNAMRIDRNTGAILRTAQQPAGLYTYSDFTGYELRHFTAPRGTYTQDLQGCGPNTNFRFLSWDAIQSPPTTQIQVYVKAGATIADLSNPATQTFGPFTHSPVDLHATGVPALQYIQVNFVFISLDQQSTPVLIDFTVSWDCMGQIG